MVRFKTILLIIFAIFGGVTAVISPYTLAGVKQSEINDNKIDVTLPEYEDAIIIEPVTTPSVEKVAGLYDVTLTDLVKTWETLLSDGDIVLDGGQFKVNNKKITGALIVDNISRLTILDGAFSDCSNLTDIDVSLLNTENVKSMNALFSYCKNISTLKLNNFNTRNVDDMNSMFSTCESLVELDLSSFNTENVLNMGNMFGYCSSLQTIDLSSFNTKNVKTMQGMFMNCSSLTSLNLCNFDISNVDDIVGMFYGCKNLSLLNISNFDFTKFTDVNSYEQMFGDVPANCEIVVKDEAAKTWINTNFPTMTNVKIKTAEASA